MIPLEGLRILVLWMNPAIIAIPSIPQIHTRFRKYDFGSPAPALWEGNYLDVDRSMDPIDLE